MAVGTWHGHGWARRMFVIALSLFTGFINFSIRGVVIPDKALRKIIDFRNRVSLPMFILILLAGSLFSLKTGFILLSGLLFEFSNCYRCPFDQYGKTFRQVWICDGHGVIETSRKYGPFPVYLCRLSGCLSCRIFSRNYFKIIIMDCLMANILTAGSDAVVRNSHALSDLLLLEAAGQWSSRSI